MSKYRYPGYPSSKIKLEPPPDNDDAASTANALHIKDEEREDVEMGVASGLTTVDAFAKPEPEDGPAFEPKHEERLPSSPKYDVLRFSPQPKREYEEEPKREEDGEGQAPDASDLFKDDPFEPSASTSTSNSHSHALKPDPDDEGEEEIDEPETSLEPSPDPNPDDADVKPSLSKSTKRGKSGGGKGGKAGGGAEKAGPQLIGHLPKAEEDAMKTFVEMTKSHYQYATLGRSREALESMTCDCVYDPSAGDDPDIACGHDSDCINRLTQVECMPDDCRCKSYCRNQRFQRLQYAPIDIVQTEKKGFGLRAAADLRKDTFIYEYVGDVISHPTFVKRMREYAEEGIRHFYFMMLQKDEYIDATKRGGIGRFANHSCNPNCYVAKWTVGSRIRMGIFANRFIRANEELTFNYNVDRYGHDAQPCYCGEPKCVGFIGGKTQTDLAAMDDLYLDALGISDEVDRLGLKGNKKKKGKKLDEDFVPLMTPLLEREVPKVVQAMRQTQSRKVMFKLLTRIKITDDQFALRQVMRLRGFSLMTNLLEDYAKDDEIRLLALECMSTWPLISRNKIQDSKVDESVKACVGSSDVDLHAKAEELLAQWDRLEVSYRIPKRPKRDLKTPSPEPEHEHEPGAKEVPWYPRPDGRRPQVNYALYDHIDYDYKRFKRVKTDDDEPVFVLRPAGWNAPEVPETPKPKPEPYKWEPPKKTWEDLKKDRDAIIAAAAAQQEEERAKLLKEAKEREAKEKRKGRVLTTEEREERDRKRKERKEKERAEKERKKSEDKEANREKRLLKLVGAVVVKSMSKYRAQMDVETFKKHAKELTHIIAEKEKKSTSYQQNKLDSLSEEKAAKIKKYARDYIAKVLHKLEKAGKLRKRPPESSLSASTSTPTLGGSPSVDSLRRGDADGDGDGPMMSVEEAMGMSEDEKEDDEKDENEDKDADDDDDEDVDMEEAPSMLDERTPVELAESDTSTAVATDSRRKGRDSNEPLLDSSPRDGDVLIKMAANGVGKPSPLIVEIEDDQMKVDVAPSSADAS